MLGLCLGGIVYSSADSVVYISLYSCCCQHILVLLQRLRWEKTIVFLFDTRIRLKLSHSNRDYLHLELFTPGDFIFFKIYMVEWDIIFYWDNKL